MNCCRIEHDFLPLTIRARCVRIIHKTRIQIFLFNVICTCTTASLHLFVTHLFSSGKVKNSLTVGKFDHSYSNSLAVFKEFNRNKATIAPLQQKLNVVEFDNKVPLNCVIIVEKIQLCKIARLPELF